jgi:hypothetical protein
MHHLSTRAKPEPPDRRGIAAVKILPALYWELLRLLRRELRF